MAESDRDLVLQCAPDLEEDWPWLHAFYERLGFRDTTEPLKLGGIMVYHKISGQ